VEKAKRGSGGFVSDTGALSNFAMGWWAMGSHFWALVGIGILVFLVGLPGTFVEMLAESTVANDIVALGALCFSFLYSIFVLYPLGAGFQYVFLKAARNISPSAGDLFAPFSRNYWGTLGTVFLVGLAAIVPAVVLLVLGSVTANWLGYNMWLDESPIGLLLILLFVLPAIYIGIRLSFALFLAVDEQQGPLDAIGTSWSMTRDHVGTYVLMVVIFVVGMMASFVLGGLLIMLLPTLLIGIVLLIGLVVANLWVQTTVAVFYNSVKLSYDRGRKVKYPGEVTEAY